MLSAESSPSMAPALPGVLSLWRWRVWAAFAKACLLRRKQSADLTPFPCEGWGPLAFGSYELWTSVTNRTSQEIDKHRLSKFSKNTFDNHFLVGKQHLNKLGFWTDFLKTTFSFFPPPSEFFFFFFWFLFYRANAALVRAVFLLGRKRKLRTIRILGH